jgi:hypothetical protein
MDIVRNQADELVREARSKAIEREHRSKGSILDTRELYKIVDPPLYNDFEAVRRRKGKGVTLAAMVLSDTQQAAAAENEANEQANTANNAGGTGVGGEGSTQGSSNNTKRAGFSFQVESDFKMEEALWKTKSAEAESIQKRRYENAELHKFRENLTAAQKQTFREKIVERVRELAGKYRDEMIELKRELDRNGMFHPAANAHRVHCMYLMKLHKGYVAEQTCLYMIDNLLPRMFVCRFTVETIEVPILRSLKAEELTKARHDAYEEEKRARLIKLATEGKSADTEFAAKLLDTSPIVEGTCPLCV